MKKIKVAVMGASGYAGLELVRLLSRHPGVDLTAVTSREWAGKPFSEVFPALARICDLPFIAPDPEAIAAAGGRGLHQRAAPDRHGGGAPAFGAGLQGGGPERRLPLQGRRGL